MKNFLVRLNLRNVVTLVVFFVLFVFSMAKADDEFHVHTSSMDHSNSENLEVSEKILAGFNHEPSVQEVQRAALKYAQIHAEDIKSWRKGAVLQAIVPSTTVGIDYYTRENSTHAVSQNINFRDEPDRYIIGPDEHKYYLYDYDYVKYRVSLDFDLHKYFYNPESLRIRREAEDLVDFRNRIAEGVIRLYFERRKLQVYLLFNPDVDRITKIDNELKIQELTAILSSMTGGYFLDELTKEN